MIEFGHTAKFTGFCPQCGLSLYDDNSCPKCKYRKPPKERKPRYSGKSRSVNKFNDYQ